MTRMTDVWDAKLEAAFNEQLAGPAEGSARSRPGSERRSDAGAVGVHARELARREFPVNTTARLNRQGRNVELTNYGCGHIGMENHAIAFWQSRMTRNGEVAEPLQLTDIRALAKAVRASNEEQS